MYKKIEKFLKIFFKPPIIYKCFFSISPMYIRTTGKIKYVSDDLYKIRVEIPLSYKNRNYVGSMFGGSLLSATDPIYMLQLIHILGKKYVVWDKSATIHYKRPVKEKVFALFEFEKNEIEQIIIQIKNEKEINLTKKLFIKNEKDEVFCHLEKVLYIADRKFYFEKMKLRKMKILENTKKEASL